MKNLTMKVGAAALALCAVVLPSFAGDRSDPALVYLRTDTSSFWHTATNSTMTLPVDFPYGASSATLTVSGAFGYSQTIDGITTPFVTVALPEATMPDRKPATEDVYDFTLTFDDGTVRTAKLGFVSGLGDGRGATRCLAPASGRAWERVNGQVAIPIPYGMTSFEIDGVAVETGLGGAQGWCAVKLGSKVPASLSGVVDGEPWTAALRGAAMGFLIAVQ